MRGKRCPYCSGFLEFRKWKDEGRGQYALFCDPCEFSLSTDEDEMSEDQVDEAIKALKRN